MQRDPADARQPARGERLDRRPHRRRQDEGEEEERDDEPEPPEGEREHDDADDDERRDGALALAVSGHRATRSSRRSAALPILENEHLFAR